MTKKKECIVPINELHKPKQLKVAIPSSLIFFFWSISFYFWAKLVMMLFFSDSFIDTDFGCAYND